MKKTVPSLKENQFAAGVPPAARQGRAACRWHADTLAVLTKSKIPIYANQCSLQRRIRPRR